jgi:hypothetical protein
MISVTFEGIIISNTNEGIYLRRQFSRDFGIISCKFPKIYIILAFLGV